MREFDAGCPVPSWRWSTPVARTRSPAQPRFDRRLDRSLRHPPSRRRHRVPCRRAPRAAIITQYEGALILSRIPDVEPLAPRATSCASSSPTRADARVPSLGRSRRRATPQCLVKPETSRRCASLAADGGRAMPAAGAAPLPHLRPPRSRGRPAHRPADLLSEIRQALDLDPGPGLEGEGVGERDEGAREPCVPVGLGEPPDPVLRGTRDHGSVGDLVRGRRSAPATSPTANASPTGATSSGSIPWRSSRAGGIDGI